MLILELNIKLTLTLLQNGMIGYALILFSEDCDFTPIYFILGC